MGNVYHIAVMQRPDCIFLPDRKTVIAVVEQMIDVHRAENLEKVLQMLRKGIAPQVIREMICPHCLELTGQDCKCMEVTI